MRTRNKAFLSCLVLAGAMLAASGAMAQPITPPGPPPMACPAGAFTVTASALSVVSCTESSTGTCTEISYTVSGTPGDFANTDHVGALEGLGVAYVKANGYYCSDSPCQIFPAGQGDNLTGLGKAAVHEQAVRVNPNDTKSTSFTIGVAGNRQPAATTVLVKKGKAVNSCRILGVGDPPPPTPPELIAPVVESYTHGNCTLVVTMLKKNGTVLSAELTPESIQAGCNLLTAPVEDLSLTLGGQPLGNANFGKGYIQTGSESCTTYSWGGRVYSFGSPCPY